MRLLRSVIQLILFVVFIVGLTACGGGSGGGTNTGPTIPTVAFVTSVTGTGDLSSWVDAGGNTGLAAADSICQARAQAASLPGTFAAWLSDSNDDAYCRTLGLTGKKSENCGQVILPVEAGPWVRTDGFPFSAEIDQLTNDNVIYTPLRHDEFGATVAARSFYTTTNPDGTLELFRTTCTDWTVADASVAGGGSTERTVFSWTDSFGLTCTNPSRLACFQTGAGSALPPFASTGQKVFVTSILTDGALGGITGGDAFCQGVADSAGVLGNFKAWLSDGTSDIVDRLVSNGPWVRLDGVKIADDKIDLTDGTLFTSISVDETGIYPPSTPFTGTNSSGRTTGTHCQNWTSNDPGQSGTRGSASSADDGWTEPVTATCSGIFYNLYCFED